MKVCKKMILRNSLLSLTLAIYAVITYISGYEIKSLCFHSGSDLIDTRF